MHGQPPPHLDWIVLASAGRDGRDAVMPHVRGTYDSELIYEALDIVASNGGSFIARMDNPGACPGEGWQMIAKQGRVGPPGERGMRGEPGTPGATGPRGESAPMFRRWDIDRKGFTATMVMSDGTRGPTLELRELFEQFQIETE